MLACSPLGETEAGTTPGVQNVLQNFLAGMGTSSMSREDGYSEKRTGVGQRAVFKELC